MTLRWHHAPIVLLGLQYFVWFLAASIESGGQQVMQAVNPAEAAEQLQIVVDLSVIGALNLLVSILFVLRRSAFAWLVVLGFEAAVFLFALAQAIASDDAVGWSWVCGLALLALGSLTLLRTKWGGVAEGDGGARTVLGPRSRIRSPGP